MKFFDTFEEALAYQRQKEAAEVIPPYQIILSPDDARVIPPLSFYAPKIGDVMPFCPLEAMSTRTDKPIHYSEHGLERFKALVDKYAKGNK